MGWHSLVDLDHTARTALEFCGVFAGLAASDDLVGHTARADLLILAFVRLALRSLLVLCALTSARYLP